MTPILLAMVLTSTGAGTSACTDLTGETKEWCIAAEMNDRAAAQWKRTADIRGVRIEQLYGDLRAANARTSTLAQALTTLPRPIVIERVPTWTSIVWIGVVVAAIVGSSLATYEIMRVDRESNRGPP